jgi:hypothetical protein
MTLIVRTRRERWINVPVDESLLAGGRKRGLQSGAAWRGGCIGEGGFP